MDDQTQSVLIIYVFLVDFVFIHFYRIQLTLKSSTVISLNKLRSVFNFKDKFKIKAQRTQFGGELTISISFLPSQPIVNFAYLEAPQL